MRKKALTKDERKIQIINWFAIRIQHDNDDWATVYEIARGLGMSPSGHLANIIKEMVTIDETLEDTLLGKVGRFLNSRGYRLKRGTFQRSPKQRRAITVKSSRGIEQMELF